MDYICSKCGKRENVNTRKPACECGGLWKLDYKGPAFRQELVDRDTWGIFRYRAFMPLSDGSWQDITLGEGMTPVIRFSENVLLKMDYCMPTCPLKTGGGGGGLLRQG